MSILNEERPLKQIKEDIKIISSNKLSITQSKLLFIGITYELILRKDLFPKNENLKTFIDNIYVKRFKDQERFKDYLYYARTILASRVQKKIMSDLDYNQILEIVSELYDILPEDDINKNRTNKKGSNNDAIIEWMNFIKNRDVKDEL